MAKINQEALIAPLFSSACLWWKYSIEKYQRSSKSSTWVTIESGTSETGFYIDGNSGLCLVMPQGADLSARAMRRWRGRNRRPTSASQQSSTNSDSGLLSALSTVDIGFGKRYRYTEHLIKDGDPLYVLGHFEPDATGQRTLSIEKIAGNILRTWKEISQNCWLNMIRTVMVSQVSPSGK